MQALYSAVVSKIGYNHIDASTNSIVTTNSNSLGYNIFDDIAAVYVEANSEPKIEIKREIYNQIFIKIQEKALQGPLSSELNQELHKLFETYVATTWYNKASLIRDSTEVDRELGFRNSALLMEYSFLVQLQELQLYDSPLVDWKLASSLEDLLKTLTLHSISSSFIQVTIDEKVLASKAQDTGIRDQLAKTLMRLTFSHQNIPLIRSKIPFNEKWEAIAECVIGNDTLEQKKMLTDYQYNRVGVIFERLKVEGRLPEGKSELVVRMELYDDIKKKFKELYESHDPLLLRKLSQIGNMQGLTLTQDRLPSKEEVGLALGYFIEAFAVRELLVKQCQSDEEFKRTHVMSQEHKEHEYFLCNIRTGIISCLLISIPLDIEVLKTHRDALETFDSYLESIGDNNSYRLSYQEAIEKINAIV